MATKKMTKKEESSVSLQGGLKKLSAEEMKEKFAEGAEEWSDFQEFTVMVPGDFIEGKFLGEGPGREITDKITGELSQCKTWLVQAHTGLTYDILGNYNLDLEMGKLTAPCAVQIARLQNKQDGAKQIADVKVRHRAL